MSSFPEVIVPAGEYRRGYVDLPSDPASHPERIPHDEAELEWLNRKPLGIPVQGKVKTQRETRGQIVYTGVFPIELTYIVLTMTATRGEEVIAVAPSVVEKWQRQRG